MYGFHGYYERVDLGSGKSRRIAIPERILRRYLGGVGLGSWLLHLESDAGTDPLSPESPLIFCFSPLVGTRITTSAKFAVVAKSPLTGYLCDGLSSSAFALSAKARGIDALVFVGCCSEPSEWINGTLRPTHFWGRSAAETEQGLGSHGEVAAIGVAGEHLVRLATISNGGRHAGRGGLGAVMGSKRLKAIAIGGEVATPIAKPDRVASWARELSRRSQGEATARYRELGTVSNLATFNRLAVLPTRNFQHSQFEGTDALETLHPKGAAKHERSSCAHCTIGCEHRYAGDAGAATRLEYESLFALGPLCGIDDPDAVLAATRLCDELGIDTVSAGGTVAFAMECGERGHLCTADVPRFGDAEGLLRILSDMAHRRGIGELLADGSRRAAIAIGEQTLYFAPQIKGLEIPGYEPRALQAMALGFAVGTRGADHNRSGAYEVDFSGETHRLKGDARTARLALATENRAAVLDSLILCKFLRGVFDDFYSETADLLASVTGWDCDAAELERVGHRIVDLRKAFNIREGWTPEEDTLPPRFFAEPLTAGASAGAQISRERLQEMIDSYYSARGWTSTGYLPEATLRSIAEDTYAEEGA